jgi:hypothetical protein
MLASGEDAQAGFDVLPATLVVERTTDGLADERAATSSPDALVELLYEVVIETYVQSHGHMLTHRLFTHGRHLLRAAQQLLGPGEPQALGHAASE